jgi:hypothetical protein
MLPQQTPAHFIQHPDQKNYGDGQQNQIEATQKFVLPYELSGFRYSLLAIRYSLLAFGLFTYYLRHLQNTYFSVYSVSLWLKLLTFVHHRDTETTEKRLLQKAQLKCCAKQELRVQAGSQAGAWEPEKKLELGNQGNGSLIIPASGIVRTAVLG